MADDLIDVLEDLLKIKHCDEHGHVDKDCQPGRHPNRNFRVATTYIDRERVPVRIAGDCKAEVVAAVLKAVKSGKQSFSVVIGPKGGVKIGVAGEPVVGFQVYLTDPDQIERAKNHQ